MPLFKKSTKHADETKDASRAEHDAHMDPSMARAGAGSGRTNDIATAGHGTHMNREVGGAQSLNQTMPMGSQAPGGQQSGMLGQHGMPGQHGMSGQHGQPGQHGQYMMQDGVAVPQPQHTLIGSEALKNRVQEKEQEMNTFKMQSSEIAEAERLEREAALHRERAVAHGAHPENRHLGGPTHTTTGTSN